MWSTSDAFATFDFNEDQFRGDSELFGISIRSFRLICGCYMIGVLVVVLVNTG